MSDEQPVPIYFLGSGRLGIPMLDALLVDSRIKVTGIGSQIDKPSGRRRQLKPTDLAQHCLEIGLEPDRIPSVNTPEFLERMRSLGVELLIVVSFGQLLKKEILELPRFGCLNVHASILPRYRGASPISSAILNGDNETGVTFMQMDAGLDTGPVFEILRTGIECQENTATLERRLGELAARRLGDVCVDICRRGVRPRPQPPCLEAKVRKLSKDAGAIDWSCSARHISRMVRAYNPWPMAYTLVPTTRGEKRVQIVEAMVGEAELHRTVPGQVLQMQAKELAVACGEGFLRILKLIPEGRSLMTATEFLCGNQVDSSTILPSARK